MNELPPVKRVSFPTGVGDLVVPDPDTNGVVIVRDDSNGEYKRVSKDAIKPLRTETDKLIDEMVDIFEEAACKQDYSIKRGMKALAEAGYCKTKPMNRDEYISKVYGLTDRVSMADAAKLYKAGCRFLDQGEEQ